MKELLKEHEKYLDEIAFSTLQTYLQRNVPKDPPSALELGRQCYRIAMAMLEAKLSLETIASRGGFFQKHNNEIKIKLHANRDGHKERRATHHVGFRNDGDE